MRSANEYPVRVAAAPVLLSPLTGGAAEPTKGQAASRVRNAARLQERVLELYEAGAQSDGSHFCELVSPILKKSMPSETVSQDFARGRSLEAVSCKILSIRSWEKDKIPPGVDAAVTVARDVFVRFQNGEIGKVPRQTDYRLLADREWCRSWRGWPYG
jgi:hypothetical protein